MPRQHVESKSELCFYELDLLITGNAKLVHTFFIVFITNGKRAHQACSARLWRSRLSISFTIIAQHLESRLRALLLDAYPIAFPNVMMNDYVIRRSESIIR